LTPNAFNGDGVIPKDWAHTGAEALSFVTAPPNHAEIAYTRFKGQRNLPYKEAEPYKSSLYYWWWAFLRRNKQYRNTCSKFGAGKMAHLYRDFGDVFDGTFLEWWDDHQSLFAEQSFVGEHNDNHGKLTYQIDPSRPLHHIQEEVKALHMRAQAIMPAGRSTVTSTAQYPIYTNVSAHTLHRVISVWDLKQTHPTDSAYDLGILAGLRPNLMPLSKYGATRTSKALEIERHNKRARISISNQTNRYLRTAEQYIHNVGHGEFPKALRR
jgi:hypothetical protein